MPPKNRPNLTLVHSQNSPENAMLRANQHLSEGHPNEAVKLYTLILYKISPGHVCALLNRSLAYLSLNLPELAVFDAYRAGIAANQLREDENNGLDRYQTTTKFLRTEGFAVDGGQVPWTSERRRFVQSGWAHSALSSIVINDVPALDDSQALNYPRFSITKRPVLCAALEIRAIYRLCGALFMCGGGARSDALGLIDDARKRCVMERWEDALFKRLGNDILFDLMLPWSPKVESQTLSPMQRVEDEERERMLAKTTKLKRPEYDCNIHEPELDNEQWQSLLRSWVSQITSNCLPHFINIDGISDGPSKPYVEIRANRDIKAGELVLSERTRSNVTTSIPEDIFEDPRPQPWRRYYCDTCSCFMIIPQNCPRTYSSLLPTIASPSWHTSASPTISIPVSSPNSVNAFHGSDNEDSGSDVRMSTPLPPSASRTPALPSDTPSPVPSPRNPPDVTFCEPTHPIPTCSPHCRTARTLFDTILHSVPLERELRNDHLLPPPNREPLSQRKRKCLIDLLLLRIFANAYHDDMHPLQDKELLFATCGAGLKDKEDEQRSWDFTDNVVRPLWILDQFFNETEQDQFARLEWCDGWVLETLRDRIDTAIKISQAPVFAKVFDNMGKISKSACVGDEAWNDLIMLGRAEEGIEEEESEVWSATLHPFFNMIRIADPLKGEKPNVRVVRREGVECFAVGGAGEVVVRAGEALVWDGFAAGVEGRRVELGVEGGAMDVGF